MEGLDLPPWLQTTLTVLGILAVLLPPLGRLLAAKWPDFGARVEALGVDLRTALGKTPPAGMPRGISPATPLPTDRAENAATVVRAEMKAAAKSVRTPPVMPMLLLAFVVSCTPAERIQAANAHRETGHASAHALGADAPEVRSLSAYCDYEALEGKPDARERSIDLDNRGCVRALGAQTAFSAAHRAEVHAIEAAQRGECVIGAPRSLPACDLLGMARHTLEAGIALADATAEVVAAVRGAR